jgi:heme exporter protein D
MAEFFAMGGYAAFVWPAWGVGVAVLAMITVHTILHKRRTRMQLAVLEAGDDG